MKIRDLTFKAQLGPPSKPARSVNPRKDTKLQMRIVVCDSTMDAWYEGDEKEKPYKWDLIELIHYLRRNWPEDKEGKKRTTPIMLVCHNPHKVLEKVHAVFKNDPEWQIRLSVNTPERFHLDGTVRASRVQTTQDLRVSLFGFRSKNRKTKYFHPITPIDFMDDFSQYGEKTWPEYIRLYHWAGHVRKWMRRHNMRFTATRGGLSSQLLKDKRFYPNSRRKVPKLTNENARSAMPGNFYAMVNRGSGRMFSKVYLIDQENAHHYAAENVDFPNANSLFARGRFAVQSDSPYARNGSVTFDSLLNEHGLYRVRMWIPNHLSGMLPPWAMNSGLVNAYLFSNEIELALNLGIEIRHIAYAWTSPDTDSGLKTYAEWAQKEIERYPEHKPWLKPTLLSAYGILGARPRHIEMAYWKSKKGEKHRFFLGPTPLIMKRHQTKKKIQPAIANTIHRGMIEAETRRLSIELAKQLENEGHEVLAIHADALLVHDEGQQLPLLPPPWRVKERLRRFKAIDQVSYEALGVVVLPGRKRAAKR